MAQSPWKSLLTFAILNLVLLVLVFPALEPGSPSHTVAIFSFLFLVPVLVGLLAVIHWDWNPF